MERSHLTQRGHLPEGPTSTLIVGAGLAGLAAAIRIKENNPNDNVVIIEKRQSQSNTQIAGQRYRSGITNIRKNDSSEMKELLASRNEGMFTPQMDLFVDIALSEINSWQTSKDFVHYEDHKYWFGPHWGYPNQAGSGRGRSVLEWFRDQAKSKDISFVDGEVIKINTEQGHANNVIAITNEGLQSVSAASYIFANGTVSGSLYNSTNKSITNSAHELAFNAGIGLADSTVHMIHPFGNSDSKGKSRIGCFETDKLAGAKVYLDGLSANPIFDKETTDLLSEHRAHYVFKQLAERFREYGSVVLLGLPDGREKYARVSHHYGHVGIDTTDGVSIKGLRNAYAVGDASAIGYWTNHRERLPGFALAKCLVDAALCTSIKDAEPEAIRFKNIKLDNRYRAPNKDQSCSELKDINTANMLEWLSPSITNKQRRSIAARWFSQLGGIDNHLAELSLATAQAHFDGADLNAEVQPIMFKQNDVDVRRTA